MRVTFFLADEPRLDRLEDLDPDADWREFQLGEHAWILQTYLRLTRAGHAATLTDRPPGDGLIVFHAKQRRQLMRHRRRLGTSVLVGVRADNRAPLMADFEILQNGRFDDGRRCFHVPHWPQPGLAPRDPARGTTIKTVAYKGFHRNLHHDFQTPAWSRFFARHGLAWSFDSVAFAERDTDPQAVEWPDYRQVDLVLAVRPPDPRLHTAKPATKLINAWLAGVPALLGPEFAYRELRRSDLDYLEVAGREEAEAAIERLLADPGFYASMVENGRRRAAEYRLEDQVGRWAELLYRRIPAAVTERPTRWRRRSPVALHLRRLSRLLSPHPDR